MSGRVETPPVGIRRFRDGDEPGVLDLLAASLGGGPLGYRSPEFFRWKHHSGPFGPSVMLVAELEGRIVGLRAFMRWRLRSGGRTLSAVRAVDTATHPDHQRTGVFSRLTRTALDSLEGVDLVFNTPNPQSLPGYVKLGWRVTGTLPVAVRVRRPLRFARRMAWGGGGDRPPAAPPVAAEPAAEALADAEATSLLLADACAGDAGLTTPRDPEYLGWRYASAPGLDYRAVVEERSGRLRGLAIFRVRRRGRLWESAVTELIALPGERAVARRLLHRVSKAARVDHVICAFPAATAPLSTGARAGFLPTRRGPTLAVKPLRPVSPDPGDLRSWSLSVGDLELF